MDAGIKINLITKTYNSEKILPYFFRYYDQFVTNYYIWDNESTDNTLDILRSNFRVTTFNNPEKEFDDYKHRDFKNNAWKQFKNCDYIINCDIDEFLYHQDIKRLLRFYKKAGFNLIGSNGYQMFSETFPTEDKQIFELVNTGVRDENYDKPIIFNPSITPIYSFGSHKVENYTLTNQSEIKLLHYKMIGIEFINDILARNERLSERNKNEKLSLWPDEKGNRFNPYEVWGFMKLNSIRVV